MSQSQQTNDEEIKDKILAIFEEHELGILDLALKVEKIEEDAKMLLDQKCIAIKNRLINDETVKDEDLEKKYLEEIEEIGKVITKEVELKLKELTDDSK